MAVNRAKDSINHELAQAARLPPGEVIEWVSPLPPNFKEYHDQDALNQLGIHLPKKPLDDFWPKRGPVWDALARTRKGRGRVFLVEAKAHIPEVNSPASAASPASMKRIAASLRETQSFLNADPSVDWTRTFFQYTNRIAHLYLLRELNDIDAYLVNVYFLNDAKKKGPTSVAEWKGAITLLKTHLGVTRTKLTPFMLDVFIDTKMLENAARRT